MNLGDKVRVKHPTGGVQKSDTFTVVEVPKNHERGVYKVRGEVTTGFGTRRMIEGGFHHSSLELIEEDHVVGAAYDDGEDTQVHICTCGDCESEAFSDRCKYEIALRALVDAARYDKYGAHIIEHEPFMTAKAMLRSESCE